MSEEEKIVTFQISEGKPLVIDFGGNETARFHKVTIDAVDKEHPTKLIAEYDQILPESVESGELKTERQKHQISIFENADGTEFEIDYHPDATDNAKFIVEGPGVVTVHGKFGPKGAFFSDDEEEEEEEEEEEGKESKE